MTYTYRHSITAWGQIHFETVSAFSSWNNLIYYHMMKPSHSDWGKNRCVQNYFPLYQYSVFLKPFRVPATRAEWEENNHLHINSITHVYNTFHGKDQLIKAAISNVQLQEHDRIQVNHSPQDSIIQLPYSPQTQRLALIALSPHSAHTIGKPHQKQLSLAETAVPRNM